VKEAHLSGAILSGVILHDLYDAAESKHEIPVQNEEKANIYEQARDVAKKHLGNDVIVTSALTGRTYSGEIIGVIGDGPDKTTIQAISDNHAILHDIRNISEKSEIQFGEDVKLATDEHGYSVIKSKGPEEQNNDLAREGLKR